MTSVARSENIVAAEDAIETINKKIRWISCRSLCSLGEEHTLSFRTVSMLVLKRKNLKY